MATPLEDEVDASDEEPAGPFLFVVSERVLDVAKEEE